MNFVFKKKNIFFYINFKKIKSLKRKNEKVN
jgi:hypothetical protein